VKGCDITIRVKPPRRDQQVHIGTEFKLDQHLCILKNATEIVCSFQAQDYSLKTYFANLFKQCCDQAPCLGMSHIANGTDENCIF